MSARRSTQKPGTYLVERYWPGVSRERLAEAEARLLRVVRELAASGTPIRMLGTTFIPADEVVLTLFEAVHPDDVLEANRRSGVPCDRVQPVEISRHDQGAER